MHRSTTLAVAIALAGLTACSHAATQSGTDASAPQPAAHQHAQAGAVATAAAVALPDTGDERVRHNRHFLVTTDTLAALLPRGRLVVIHVGRTDSAYRASHIPGAVYLPLRMVATTVNEIPNQFPEIAELTYAFGRLGVGDSNRVVIYGDDAGILAARAWVALDLLGHGDRAALLDGGLTKWRAEQRQLDTGFVMPPRLVPFSSRWQADRIVDAAWVRAHLGDSTVVLVDSRPADQFAGAEAPCQPNQPACVQIPEARRGHILGAKSLPWMDALASRDNPVLKPMHELHHLLWQPAGADAPHVRTVVTYCRTGMQASHAYFVARYIGYRDVRLYDGSFIEWSGRPAAEHPVSRESSAGAHQHH